MTTSLELDPAIRDWVLLPIVVVMFVTSLLRHHITLLLRAPPKHNADAAHSAALLRHAASLRAYGSALPPRSFAAQRNALSAPDGVLAPHAAAKPNALANPALDPSAMTGMLTNNVALVVPQIALMSWVSYFFSGFVLVRFPFPSTLRFKVMLQQGIALDSLDPSYVSSLSWYFLTLFGLRGLLAIVLGEGNAADDLALMRQQQTGGMAGGGANPDQSKLFAAEIDNLKLTNPEWAAAAALKRVEARARTWQKQQAAKTKKSE